MHQAPEAQATASPVTITKDDVCKVLTDKRAMLMSLIKRVVKDNDAAEDIYSQVCIQALACAEKEFRGESSLSTYIGSMAYNAACRHSRKQTNRMNAGVFFEHELSQAKEDEGDSDAATDRYDAEGDDATPDTVFEHRRLLKRTEEAIEVLKHRMAASYECWKMHRLQGMPYEEIEAQLQVNRITARTRVHKFTSALTKQLGLKPGEIL